MQTGHNVYVMGISALRELIELILNSTGAAYIHGLVCFNNPLWWNPNPPEWSAYLAEVGRALRAEGPYSGRAVPPAVGDNGMDDPPIPSSSDCGAYLDAIIGLGYSPYD